MTAPTIHTKRVAQSVSDMVQEWFSKFDVPHMTTDLFENRLARFQNESTPNAAYVAGLEAAGKAALNFIQNTESEMGIILGCGDSLRAALSASPNAPDVRTVTVAQLERWAADADEHAMIKEIRAVIGEPRK